MTTVATAVATPPTAASGKAAAPTDPGDAAAFSSKLDSAQAELESAAQAPAADAKTAANPTTTAALAEAIVATPAEAVPPVPAPPALGGPAAVLPTATTPAAPMPAAPVLTAPVTEPAPTAPVVPVVAPAAVAAAPVEATSAPVVVAAQAVASTPLPVLETADGDDDNAESASDAAVAPIVDPTLLIPAPPLPAPPTPPASAAPLAGGTPSPAPIEATAAATAAAPAAPVADGTEPAPVVAQANAPAYPPVASAPPAQNVSAPAPVAAPSAPAPAAEIPPLAGQLARPLLGLRSAGDGNHILTISVTPENLGPVTVRAHVSGDTVRIELVAPTDQARDAIKAILPDLRRDLFQQGSQTSLDLFSGGQGGAGGFRDTDPAPRQQDRLLPREAAIPRPRANADSLLDVLA